MLQVKFECQFNDFATQANINLPSDTIIGLFGASGSGKSTFIRTILGFDKNSVKQVQIKFDQQTWADSDSQHYLSVAKRGIGYLPQSIDLFPHMSVLENILFAKKRNSKIFTDALIDKIIGSLDLKNVLTKKPSQLSGGQCQRTALARAIIASSKLLILDEPLSAVGEDHKPAIMQFLKFLNSQYNIPIIFSSHNRYEQAFLAEFLVTFDAGLIVQSGPYQTVATNINGRFSQMSNAVNRIKAKVVEYESEYSVNLLKTQNHKLWAGHIPLRAGSQVNLEIRAQDISISLTLADKSSILNNLAVTIANFEEISVHQYIVKLAFENSFLVAFITKKSFCILNLKKDQKVYANFKSVSIVPISTMAEIAIPETTSPETTVAE